MLGLTKKPKKETLAEENARLKNALEHLEATNKMLLYRARFWQDRAITQGNTINSLMVDNCELTKFAATMKGDLKLQEYIEQTAAHIEATRPEPAELAAFIALQDPRTQGQLTRAPRGNKPLRVINEGASLADIDFDGGEHLGESR